MSEHTPTPWYNSPNSFGMQFIYGNDIEVSPSGKGYSKLICGGDIPMTLTAANAAFIVEAVNNYESLRERLEFAEFEWRRATDGMKERDATIESLRAELAAAEERVDGG